MTFTQVYSLLFFIPNFSPTCYLDNTEEEATWVDLRWNLNWEEQGSEGRLSASAGCPHCYKRKFDVLWARGNVLSWKCQSLQEACTLRAAFAGWTPVDQRHLGFVPASREREAELSLKHSPSLASVAQSSLWIYARQVLNILRSLRCSCFCDLLCQMTLQSHYGTWLTDFWSSPSA